MLAYPIKIFWVNNIWVTLAGCLILLPLIIGIMIPLPVKASSVCTSAFDYHIPEAEIGSLVVLAPLLVPTSPTNLIVLAMSSTQTRLMWKDNSINESGFEVWRQQTKPGIEPGTTITSSLALVGKVNANMTIFSDTGLSPNVTYRYQVYAFNVAGHSDFFTGNQAALPCLSQYDSELNQLNAQVSDLDLQIVTKQKEINDYITQNQNISTTQSQTAAFQQQLTGSDPLKSQNTLKDQLDKLLRQRQALLEKIGGIITLAKAMQSN